MMILLIRSTIQTFPQTLERFSLLAWLEIRVQLVFFQLRTTARYMVVRVGRQV